MSKSSSSSLSRGSIATSTELLDSSDEPGIIDSGEQRRTKTLQEDGSKSPRRMKHAQKTNFTPKKSPKALRKTTKSASNTGVKLSRKHAKGFSAETVSMIALPTCEVSVDEKFEEERKRSAVENFLASPRRLAVCPVVTHQPVNPSLPSSPNHPSTPAKLTFSDVIIAASAAKAMSLKSRNEVAPPTEEEVVERQCRRLLSLSQRWVLQKTTEYATIHRGKIILITNFNEQCKEIHNFPAVYSVYVCSESMERGSRG